MLKLYHILKPLLLELVEIFVKNVFLGTTPPPGAYDPKFETDMSITAARKPDTSSQTSFHRIPSVSSLLAPRESKKEIFRSRPTSPANTYINLRSSSFQRLSVSSSSEKDRRNTVSSS